MLHSYYVVHLEEKDKINNIIYAQLRRFAYPGAFASSVWDEFDLKDYDLHPIKVRQLINKFTNERKMETNFLSWSDIVSNNEYFSYIMQECKEILIKRNPNIDVSKIQ